MISSSPQTASLSDSNSTSQSQGEDSSSGQDSAKKSKRKRVYTPPPKSDLPQRVSLWTRRHAEAHAGIVYARNYTVGHIEGLKPYIHGKILDFTQKQKDYMEYIDKHVIFNIKERYLCSEGLYKANVEPVFCSILEKLGDCDENVTCMRIRNFIKVMNKIYDCKLVAKLVTECTKNYLEEGLLVRLVGCFAELCDLSVDYCNQADTTKLYFANTKVRSTPDLRLHKQGIDARGPEAVISVVEVKTWKAETYITGSPRGKHCLEIDVHDNTLGQHAGELLLDLHRRYAGKDSNEYKDDQKISMLGMIAVGTNVYMTVLEMTWKHYQNLRSNRKLEPNDKAIIYYSDPLDILAHERNLLIRNFMTLNNIEYN